MVKHGEGVDEEGEPVEGKYGDEEGKLENGGDCYDYASHQL